MGTNFSPFLANLSLFMYELEYFTQQISTVRAWHADVPGHPQQYQLDTIRRLSFCTRYIDDLWNPLVGKTEFQKIAKKIYPSWLKLGLEDSGVSVNYLDMTIWHSTASNEPVCWHSKLYDKKVGLIEKGLKLNRFPHPASKLSHRCKYGVIASQLHGYNTVCTENKWFLVPALSLYTAYVKKGYTIRCIDKYFEKFIRNHMQGLRPNAVKQLYHNTRL